MDEKNVSQMPRFGAWLPALIHGLLVLVPVLGLMVYWFAIADRYRVFLYFHDMGPRVPDTAPFSQVTASRYWMAGLVAAGAVLALNTGINWLLGRLAKNYRPPDWRQVWVICAVPLLVAIPLLVMTVNTPTLPPLNAAQVTLATLAGLALALLPGRMAVERPLALALLAADGLGLMLLLTLAPALENLPYWLAHRRMMWVWLMGGMFTAGAAWLLVMSAVYVLWRKPAPGAGQLFAAGLTVAYLVMPLAHHVLFSDGYYYITNSDNFIPDSWPLRIGALAALYGIAWGLARLREALIRRRMAAQARPAS